MLSDRTARERYLRETPWADERQDFEACEARRILAVAEPDSPNGRLYLTCHKRAGYHSGLHGWPGGRDALAEALAAFVGASDPADYLARKAQAAKVRESILRVAAGFESHA